ncbi:MAG: phage holin family protein [Gallionellaceae bacterium]|nr:phage holin family protein [Gallionellaceae bacterium]
MSNSQPGANAGLLDSIKALGITFLALVRTRAELIAVELQEDRERIKEIFILSLVSALFCTLGLLLLAVFIVVYYWDSYRLLAIGGVTVVYSGVGIWTLIELLKRLRNNPPLLATTLQEFDHDIDILSKSHE